MPSGAYLSEELLEPVRPEEPAGDDLRFKPIFGEIQEARRVDDVAGKSPQWELVAQRSLEALRLSKDLRLCCFVTEAALQLDGFAGLKDSLRLTKEILTRFWDQGLFPRIENGDLDYRAGALGWFNERMPDGLRLVPLTSRKDGGENYSYARYLQAQRIGTEEGIQKLSDDKRDSVKGLRAQGWITLDAFDAAMAATKLDAFETIHQAFEESRKQFLLLDDAIDERFGVATPSFAAARAIFEDMRLLFETVLAKKREAAPAIRLEGQPRDGKAPSGMIAGIRTTGVAAGANGSWQEAESLIQAGSVDQGLQQMAELAAQETSDRARFLRKLMLVDVCRGVGRERLARTILEELNRQITEYKLDRWESSELVGAVWSRLYRVYKKSDASSDQDQAGVLYLQLCRLDPWQAYIDCED